MDKSYLVIGDLHIDSNFKDLDFVNKLSEEIDFNTVIFLGDFFDNSYNIKKSDIKKAIEFIKGINKNIIMISGNHDIFGEDINKNNNLYIYGIDRFKNVEFIVGQNRSYIEDNLIFVSYYIKHKDFITDLYKIRSYIEETNYDKYFIFSHNDISEFYMGTPSIKFPSIFDIFANITNKEIYYISGHIHEHRFIRNKNIKIISTGCLFSKDFRDKVDFPLFVHIKNNDINLYKYIYNTTIYYRFNIRAQSDINNIYSFISKYRFFNKKIKMFVYNADLYYYLVNSFSLFQGDTPKELGISKIIISMVDDNIYDNEDIIYNEGFYIDDIEYADGEDLLYEIISNYISDKYPDLDENGKMNKIELLYQTLNYIKDSESN